MQLTEEQKELKKLRKENTRLKLEREILKKAVVARKPKEGLLHHSDRGSQYASRNYQGYLKRHHLDCSMSRKGNCYDNAVVERFFGNLKSECTCRKKFH